MTHFQFKEFPDLNGRLVPYADVPGNQQTPEIKWLRANPHRLHLGQIGFVLTHADGSPARTNDLTDIEQTLDLWNGEIVSRFKFDGQPVDGGNGLRSEPRCGLRCASMSPLLKTGTAGDPNSFSLRHGRDRRRRTGASPTRMKPF